MLKYLKDMSPSLAMIIFQARSKTLDIKEHRPYKYQEQNCRWCWIENETLVHVVNCGASSDIITSVDETLVLRDDISSLEKIALRLHNFLNLVHDL